MRDHFEKVKLEGLGVCPKCRWSHGCAWCDVDKAWVYCLKKDLGFAGPGIQGLKFQSIQKASGGGGACEVEAT